MEATSETVQLSMLLPHSLDTRIYIRLTALSKAVLVLLTTAAAEEASNPTPMGSFVYALPDKYNPNQPLCTPLLTVEPTLEFTSRLAKLLARKTQLPVYVGNSISLASTGLGGTAEEEMETFKTVVEVVVPQLQQLRRVDGEATATPSATSAGGSAPNGVHGP